MLGLVSHIQGYSTKDGPGIRSTVFMMGCNLRCIWCSNPEAMYPGKKILYHEQLCQKCGKCVKYAINNSIVLTDDGCVIDRETCTNLSEMVNICPFSAYEAKGDWYTPNELATKLLKDKAFYDTSMGGVTFSGGEATMQAPFLLAVAQLLKQDNVHLTLDTAGLFDYDQMVTLFDMIDLFLFDIKAFDPNLHNRLTGVDNKIILDNLTKLANAKKNIIIRMIVVNGINDQLDDFIDRLSFIKSLPFQVLQIDLLPYHKLGIGKYKALGLKYELSNITEPSADKMQALYQISVEMGFKTTIGG